MYTSTRGRADDLDFGDVVLTGLASDGGLYCPIAVPSLDLAPGWAATVPYAEAAVEVMAPYLGAPADADADTIGAGEGVLDRAQLGVMVEAAYGGFRHPDVCPVIEVGPNEYLLDLTRGPTLAFKDIALQLVGRLLDHELTRRGEQAVVISATSGDTGSAAIEALAGRQSLHVVVLHPHERVSEVQRRQMTTVDAPNVHNLAIEGTFDHCQDLVKAAFADHSITAGRRPAAVNSINWARVMAQIVYYVVAAARVAPDGGPVSFAVPTGNFGNILSGWYAKRMGLAVDQLIVASNRNDVLARFFETGGLEARSVEPSLSPSMDIQVSSNFERLLWEASGRDGAAIAALLAEFRAADRVAVPAPWRTTIGHEFTGGRLDDDGTVAEIKRVHDETGLLIDPHTAVGLSVGRAARRDPEVPLVALATADPAKFPDAVVKATGIRPELPPFLSELFDRSEHYRVVANSPEAVARSVSDALAVSS